MSSDSTRNSFRGFLDVVSEMNRTQHQWMYHGDADTTARKRAHANAWVPITDIYAKSDDLIIRCELPGLRRDEVEVSASSGVLTITGIRAAGFEASEVSYYTRERVYGPFRRSMILPENVSQADISANFSHGLLEIVIQGGAASKVHTVDIKDNESE